MITVLSIASLCCLTAVCVVVGVSVYYMLVLIRWFTEVNLVHLFVLSEISEKS